MSNTDHTTTTMPKSKAYFYMVWTPGDDEDCLSWFTIFPTRTQANELGRQIAEERGWKFKYVSAESGKNYWDFDGKKTIITLQTDEYCHGA
jgi:hypothetical protein